MRGTAHPEPAVAPGEDPRKYARLMSAVYDATMAGKLAPTRPRRVIWDSWQRLITKGLRPDRRTPPVAGASTVETLRQDSGLISVVDEVSGCLSSLISGGDSIFALADAEGRVLWRSGSTKVLLNADKLGFVEGAHWAENTVGTNALGTALVSQRAVQVFCAEHYNRSQHPWTCAGAPIRDPSTGRVMGVIDVTGPAATVHPTTLALIDTVARLAESRLRERRDQSLNRLRAVAAPILARIGSPALAVDTDGWVAAVGAVPVQSRILLPPDVTPGHLWVPSLGMCDVETLPGGWLVRPVIEETEPAIAQVTLDLHDSAAPVLEMVGQFGSWRHDISLRHAEILLILAVRTQGRSAPELAADLHGDPSRVGAVRVEMSRLRKQFAGIVVGRPYRFASSAVVEVRYPDDRSELLAPSVAPAVRAMRVTHATTATTY
ncbi:GAF domain-containing protein [Candidatus Mycolicibacterium alkanivorans]|uniref:GAF domain-containing protein n=1 Tax=Candidatus Mycolicibacterium alkanivorans TaxID=2954114 RepID=A0ABS9YXI9_9MYCO|nr:GAF domain-containing protein [Candidatus Mycolicibacterium alkanivorans]MCI4675842.1 GAF domain-containing protein [Candidatus Mycolicibacterium alkanivorans]